MPITGIEGPLPAVLGVAGDPSEGRLVLRSLDPGLFPDRLHFNYIDVPGQNSATPRGFKAAAAVELSNPGGAPVVLRGHVLEGPFRLRDPGALDGLTLGPGERRTVEILFDRDAFAPRINRAPGVVDGALRIETAAGPAVSAPLSAVWQRVDEGSWEPNVNEIWRMLGVGNFAPGVPYVDSDPSPLFTGGLFAAFDATEALSPHWRIADGFEAATITLVARFAGAASGGERIVVHRPFQQGIEALSFAGGPTETQTVFPTIAAPRGGPGVAFDPVFASVRFGREAIPEAWPGDGAFSIAAAGYSTDPSLNGGATRPPGAPPEAVFGHWMRMFQALDRDGRPIPNVYLAIQDFFGINGDFNDNMLIVTGVEPISTPPFHVGPTAVSARAGTPLAFAGPTAIRVEDADAGLTNRFSSVLSVGAGVLRATPAGAARVEGDGTALLRVTGLPADVNRTLASLTYVADAAFAGQDRLRVVSNDRALSSEFEVAIAVAPAPARLAIAGLDGAAADARLVFSAINPEIGGAPNPSLSPGQRVRDEARLVVENVGGEALVVTGLAVGDPSAFAVVGPLPGPIAPGGRAEITVRFIGRDDARDLRARAFETTLDVESTGGTARIALAGLAQWFAERGEEPTPEQIARALGYTSAIPTAALAGGGRVETVGDEVLAPHFARLDPGAPVEITQIGAFLGAGDLSRLFLHGLAGAGTLVELFAQDPAQNQTLLPRTPDGGPARALIDRDEPFGLRIAVDGRPTFAAWSDPAANRLDPTLTNRWGEPLAGADGGHLVRVFAARGPDGAAIPGTYIVLQDYPGAVNYDYNDAVFLIRNVRPHALTAAEDADGDGVADALRTDRDRDGTVAFFDPDDLRPDLRIEAEAFTPLQGFVVANNDAASGGRVLASTGPGLQRAVYRFGALDGLYDLRLVHFDETDGVARMAILVNGETVDAWDWNRTEGSPLPDAAARAERVAGPVALQAGDVIELQGYGAPGEPLRTDRLDVSWRGPLDAPAPFRIEAEAMTPVTGFRAAPNPHASGGMMLATVGSGEETASWRFAGAAWTYDLRIGHFDETDAVARMRVLVNGTQVDAWDWDRADGSPLADAASFTVRTVPGLRLRQGDLVELSGTGLPGEPLRTDWIEFVPVAPLPRFSVEAEDFEIVQGFAAAANPHASGGRFLQAVGSGEQAARLVFTGETGSWRLGLTYFDEDDGVASLRVLIDGTEIAAWDWDQMRGSAFADPATRALRDLGAHPLRTGSVIELRGFASDGEPLRVDRLDFAYHRAPQRPAPFRVEAEDLQIVEGFTTAANPHASGGRLLQAVGLGEQIAVHRFGAEAGLWRARLGHFDETDGASSMRVLVNGTQVDAWDWDRATGSALADPDSRAVRALGDLALRPGDLIELRGFGAPAEPLRTDWLDFAWVGELTA